jgi:hypothetical protein
VECVENVIRRVCRVGAAIIEQRVDVTERVGVADEVREVADVIREHGVSPAGMAGRGMERRQVDAVLKTGTDVGEGGPGCMRKQKVKFRKENDQGKKKKHARGNKTREYRGRKRRGNVSKRRAVHDC